MPHLDELGWLIHERKVVDFRGMPTVHQGNYPTLNLIICDIEDIMGILKYMVIWKLEWVASKELLRCLGWSIINSLMMNPSPVEVPNGHCVQNEYSNMEL